MLTHNFVKDKPMYELPKNLTQPKRIHLSSIVKILQILGDGGHFLLLLNFGQEAHLKTIPRIAY